MFDMTGIGKRISELRRSKNMTQVELADKLGISYQAVSNWERGDSMPDIAKLNELSEIFDISIDELLDNKRKSKIINDINKDKKIYKDTELEDLKDILPLMKPNQVKEVLEENDGEDSININNEKIDFETLIALAPFLETEELDRLVISNTGDEVDPRFIGLAPFMSEEAVGSIVKKLVDGGKASNVMGFLPFMEEEAVDSIALKLYENGNKITGFAPFMTGETINKIVKEKIKKGEVKDIMDLIPFADLNLSDIFKKQ